MNASTTIKTILVISGATAIVVGVTLLFAPVAMYASVGADVSGSVSLLSDLRATGGALLASGILIASGAFFANLTFTALVLSTVVYLGYGSSRLLAMAIDGKPADELVYVAVLELVIGLANALGLIRFRATRPVERA